MRQSSRMSIAVSEARMPSLCSSFATVDARRAVLDDERFDADASGRLVDGRPDHDEPFRFDQRLVSRGAEDLRAVQHPVVAVAHGRRLDRGGVRATAGLGDGHRGPLRLSAAEAGEEASLLLREFPQRRRRHRRARGPPSTDRARRRPTTALRSTRRAGGCVRVRAHPPSSASFRQRLASEPCVACHMKSMKSQGIVCSSSSNSRDTGRMNASAAP